LGERKTWCESFNGKGFWKKGTERKKWLKEQKPGLDSPHKGILQRGKGEGGTDLHELYKKTENRVITGEEYHLCGGELLGVREGPST